jgi:molybdate-binding protein
VPIVRCEFPDEDFTIVTFAEWAEGLVVAAGNPKRIQKVEDLTRRKVRFVNREAGSGSRALLDSVMQKTGMAATDLAGYEKVAEGHLAATYAVRSGEADCCIATESAARTFGLDFVPLQSERYDFVLRRTSLELPAVQSFLEVLQRSTLRRKLEGLAGYETGRTGSVVV